MKRKKLGMMLAMLVILAGVFVPGTVVRLQERFAASEAQPVPEKYDSAASAAVSRSASATLTTREKLQLVTGKWESTTEDAFDESELSGYEAQKLARAGIKTLCGAGLYPQPLAVDYGNWYNWKAECFKAVDTTFRTYTAYYWRITFEKYDKSESHEIWMLDDGTVFFARVESAALDLSALQTVDAALAREEKGAYTWDACTAADALSRLAYTGADLSGYTVTDALSVMEIKTEATYCTIQAMATDSYLWAVV